MSDRDMIDCNPLAFGDDEVFDNEIDEWLNSVGEEVKPTTKRKRKKKERIDPLTFSPNMPSEIEDDVDEVVEEAKPLEETSDEKMVVGYVDDELEVVEQVDVSNMPEVELDFLSGIRTAKDGRTYRIAKVAGVTQRFYGDLKQNYKLKL